MTQFPLLASQLGLSLHLQYTRRQQLKTPWAIAMLYTPQPLVVSKQYVTLTGRQDGAVVGGMTLF